MNKVTELKIRHDYKVWLRFADGYEGEIDLKPFLGKGIAADLLQEDKFKTLSIAPGGGLAWHNGYDICPNYLRELVKGH